MFFFCFFSSVLWSARFVVDCIKSCCGRYFLFERTARAFCSCSCVSLADLMWHIHFAICIDWYFLIIIFSVCRLFRLAGLWTFKEKSIINKYSDHIDNPIIKVHPMCVCYSLNGHTIESHREFSYGKYRLICGINEYMYIEDAQSDRTPIVICYVSPYFLPFIKSNWATERPSDRASFKTPE